MKINRLMLKDFIGIQKGLGRERIDLDLAGLNGLIALSGKNGAGKSTVLENLQPYRTLASRKKSLQHHVLSKNAIKELDFDFQGSQYQTRIKIDADSGKQEGYIWQNGEPLVNGSAREYDRKITEIFGSKELFFNSIFCAQNAQKLSDLTTAKLKELFSEFLRLEQYVTYEKTVKQCISALDAQNAAYMRQSDILIAKIELLTGCEKQLTTAEKARAEETKHLEKVEAEIIEAIEWMASLKETMAVMAAMEDRAGDIRQQIYDTECSMSDAKTDYEIRVSGIRDELRKCNEAREQIESVLKMRDAIEAAADRKRELNAEITDQETAMERCQTGLSNIREEIHQHDQNLHATTKPHPREHDIPVLRVRLQNAKQKAVELEKRDPDCTSNICSFIKGALDALDAIPANECELQKLETEVCEYNAHVNAVTKEAAATRIEMQKVESEAITSLADLQNSISAGRVEMAECEKKAARHDDLNVAVAQQSILEIRASELTAQGMKEKHNYNVKVSELQTKRTGLKSKLHDITSKIDNSAKDNIAEMEIVRKNKSGQKDFILNNIRNLEAEIQEATRDIDRRTTYQEEMAELNMKQVSLQKQINEWTYLKNAVSKDGLRALEIDSVAPSISAYANQILFDTFGPAYSVKLRTQDDDGRETLDILAMGEDGRETFLEDLSGGEKTWSLKALRLAMTLISKEKNGKSFKTAMADEEDGALDAGNAQSFIHMYRAFMKTGGFDSCFFISHRPEAIALSDHILHFGDGGININ